MVRISRSRFTEFDACRPDPESDVEEIEREKDGTATDGCDSTGNNQFPVLDIVVAVLRKSLLVTCSADSDDVGSSLDIGRPTDVRHVSHVTFDRFNGFLGLPSELEPEVPRKPPSASVSVFGVSAKSMQCSYDTRGNSVPTILLMMQKRLYAEGGLKAEGIFRINPENSQEEGVRRQLNKGVVPRGIDVHCLAGLIKAWFRELPTGVLDSLEPEEVMNCDTEEDCCRLLMLLPPAEAALLDWSVNLMADVVAHQRYSKMNARNVAMVFAPNMTQMADPLTALIHAVQVMNFLKTLILKNLRERDEADPNARLLSSCLVSPRDDPNYNSSDRNMEDLPCFFGKSNGQKFLRKATLWRLEADYAQSFPNSPMVNGDCGRLENRVLNSNEKDEMGNGSERGDWVSLREGVRRFCKSPMFQMSKRVKETQTLDISNVNTPEREQSWS